MVISTVGRSSPQTFLVTSTSANNLLLVLTWFLSVGARMTVTGIGSTAKVAIMVNGEDGSKTSVRAVFSDDLMQTSEGVVSKN